MNKPLHLDWLRRRMSSRSWRTFCVTSAPQPRTLLCDFKRSQTLSM